MSLASLLQNIAVGVASYHTPCFGKRKCHGSSHNSMRLRWTVCGDHLQYISTVFSTIAHCAKTSSSQTSNSGEGGEKTMKVWCSYLLHVLLCFLNESFLLAASVAFWWKCVFIQIGLQIIYADTSQDLFILQNRNNNHQLLHRGQLHECHCSHLSLQEMDWADLGPLSLSPVLTTWHIWCTTYGRGQHKLVFYHLPRPSFCFRVRPTGKNSTRVAPVCFLTLFWNIYIHTLFSFTEVKNAKSSIMSAVCSLTKCLYPQWNSPKQVLVLVLYESFLPSSGYVESLQGRLEKTDMSLRESPCLTGAPTPWAADLK